jgi:hypothetical protein
MIIIWSSDDCFQKGQQYLLLAHLPAVPDFGRQIPGISHLAVAGQLRCRIDRGHYLIMWQIGNCSNVTYPFCGWHHHFPHFAPKSHLLLLQLLIAANLSPSSEETSWIRRPNKLHRAPVPKKIWESPKCPWNPAINPPNWMTIFRMRQGKWWVATDSTVLEPDFGACCLWRGSEHHV